MLKNARPGITPEEDGKRGPMKFIEELKKKGHLVAYVGDVVGTGSSRKSATNSIIWGFGEDIPFVPNKRFGGVTLGGKIAPIFFNTQEDSGALPIEVDVSAFNMGDVIDVYPYDGKIEKDGKVAATFQLKSDVLLDEVRAGGRINLIIGRSLTAKAREFLGLPASTVFRLPTVPAATKAGFTLAQKMVGRACGLPEGQGVRPGTYCEPKMTTVGSQDTTGPMTRDELKDLACLGFSADMVMQSFCHTAAYPKPVDVKTHRELPAFISNRGGVALRPGDGVIHSWLNRLLLPDTVGTGGDSHTRFPIGISFPAGSGLVAFGAATGVMPLDMPESVLVRFKGTMQPGITLRDLVHAIPYYAIQQGLLTVAKQGKKNEFSGRILEIEGLPDLKVEQAFELSDASAERSAAGCTVKLNPAPIKEYLTSNIVLMKNMIADGYQDRRSLERRIQAVQAWLAKPELLEADKNAEYAHVIEINLDDLKEPVLCCPNDPDDARLLSAGGGHQDRRSVHRLVHDQHRPLSRGVQAARRPARHPGQAVGGPAHQDGRGRTHQGRPLRRVRHRRCAHRNAGLLAVHGQPGAGARRRHRGVHQHPQLPQPPGQEHQRVPGLGRTRGHRLQAGPHPHGGRIPGRHGRDQRRRQQDLQVPELRPDRRIQGSGRRRDGLIRSPCVTKSGLRAAFCLRNRVTQRMDGCRRRPTTGNICSAGTFKPAPGIGVAPTVHPRKKR